MMAAGVGVGVLREPVKVNVRDFNNPLNLSEEQILAMRAAATESFPREMCGLIVNGKFVQAENISPEPECTWLIDQNFQSRFVGDIDGVVHSHCKPYHREPSLHDMEGQIRDGNPWAIIHTTKEFAARPLWWGDFRLEQELKGREFIHGITDCYAAIRSWFWQKRQIYLPDVARENNWWEKPEGKGLYAEGIGSLAVQISRADVQFGDVALFQLLAKVPHHAAVITDDGQMYHHLEGQLSGETPIGRYQQFAVAWLRYKEGGQYGVE